MMETTDDSGSREKRVDAVIAAYLAAAEAGPAPSEAEWLARHPDLADDLAAFFADHRRLARFAADLPPAPASSEAVTVAPGAEADAAPSRFATSATMRFWRRSCAAAWASSSRRGRSASTAPSR